MKQSSITTMVGIFCFSYLYCYSQKQPVQHPSSIKKAVYIFEGNITQQKYYTGKHGDEYTCSVVQITKIFKGSSELKLGSIKVITPGGRNRAADSGPGLQKGHYIIFCNLNIPFRRPADSTIFKSIPTDNMQLLDCIDHVDFVADGERWGWRNPTQFKTVDSLYSFLKFNGLTVQEEAKTNQK
jgi:hypothetical protein